MGTNADLTSEFLCVCVCVWDGQVDALINTNSDQYLEEKGEGWGDRGEKSEYRQPNCYVSASCVSKGAAAGWWKQHRFPQPDWASTLSLSPLNPSSIIHVSEGNSMKRSDDRDHITEQKSCLLPLETKLIIEHILTLQHFGLSKLHIRERQIHLSASIQTP